jgi:hypothetical protein
MGPAPSTGLATLDICLQALLVLLFAGIFASIRAIRARVGLAFSTIELCE